MSKLFSALFLALLATVILLQNTETVETSFLFLSVSAPLSVLLLATLLIGFALGVILTLWYGRAPRKKRGQS
jgi:uncharacterized integral membrane protein